MIYKCFYQTPEGFSDIFLSSDGEYLTGLWFVGSKDANKHKRREIESAEKETETCANRCMEECIDRKNYTECHNEKELLIFRETSKWLDIYFGGIEPDFTPKYRIENLTDFRKEVIDIMLTIPYGETITYGDIAKRIAKNHGIEKMSAQAVGGAVGWNPIGLIIPCHRVMGTGGAITGYGGGIANKMALLALEQRENIINRDKKAVIFDMDGVIFDSERAVYEGWMELAEKYHFADLEEVYVKCIGVNSKITREIFMGHYGEDFPYDEYKAEQSRNYHAKYDGGRLPMKPGIKELLVALKANGYKTAIASSTRTALVEQQMKDAGLRMYFDVIVGGDMVERSKPEPDIFLKAAELLSVSPEQSYVIEDSYNGIRAAYAAKMIPIMVPDMLQPDDEMKAKARYICKDLYDVQRDLGI